MNATRHFYAITGLVTILTASGLATSRAHSIALGAPNTQPVLVVNTTAQAVPTSAQGITPVSGTVAVSSLPAVQLNGGTTVGVSGGVDINSLPAIQLHEGSSIDVNNGPDNPVNVKNVAVANRTYVNPTVALQMDDGNNGTISAIYTVPANKRLTITTLYGYTVIPNGEQISLLLVGNMPLDFSTPIPTQGVTGSVTHGLAQVNATFPAGTEVDAFVSRSTGTGADSVSVSFFGYLEDAP